MTFFLSFSHFSFLSIFLSSDLACVVCCVLFLLLCYLSYPDLVSSFGEPDCKKEQERDASNRDRLYDPFCFRWRVGRESIDYYFPSEKKKVTHPSDSFIVETAQLRRGQISVLVSWVNTFLKETDNRRYDFPLSLFET